MKNILEGREGKTEQGKPRLVLFALMAKMNSDLQQLVTGLIQLDERVIADLGQLEVEQLTNAVESAQRLLKALKKRVVPSQLEKHHEWVRYVLADATMNGWKSFVIKTSKTNKETYERETFEVEFRESIETKYGHVFADTGKEMTHGQAMSYAKILKDRYDVVWIQFCEEYDKLAPKAPAPKAVTVKKTLAQVMEEKMAQIAREDEEKMQKERENAKEKMRKEREKAEEKMRKELEKVEVEIQKELEKTQKKVEQKAEEKMRKELEKVEQKMRKEHEKVLKEQVEMEELKKRLSDVVERKREERKEPESPTLLALEELLLDVPELVLEMATPLPMATPPTTKTPMVAPPAGTPMKREKKELPKEELPAVDPFVPHVTGLKKWIWKGTEYLRDEFDYVWLYNTDTEDVGDFQGIYCYKLDKILECDEPMFDDEEFDD